MLHLVLLLAAATDPGLVGTWETSAMGIPMTFVVGATGSCSFMDEPMTCDSRGGVLRMTDVDGTGSYRYRVAGGELTLSGDELPVPVVFRRRGGPGPVAQPKAPPEAPPEAATTTTPARGPGGPSTALQQQAWGATLRVPAGWKAGEKDGQVLMGSDTEAGLIVVRYLPQTTLEVLRDGYAAGLHEEGINAMPSGPLQTLKGSNASGLAGEFTGQDTQGNPLRIRVVGMPTGFGGAVVVYGFTSPAQYAGLKPRADSVAQTSTFKQPPKVSGLAGNYQFFFISKDGGYSREAKLTLCQSGRFQKSGEMAGSGDAGSAVSSHGNGGSWSAVGDTMGGTLTLTFGDGSQTTLPWRVSTNPADRSSSGAAVRFGSDLYQKTGPGGC